MASVVAGRVARGLLMGGTLMFVSVALACVVGVVGESMHCWVLREHAWFGVVFGGEMVLVFTSVWFGVVPGLGVGGPVVGLFSCVV